MSEQRSKAPLTQKDDALVRCVSMLDEILQNYAFALTPDALQRVHAARDEANAAQLCDKEGG